MKAVKIKIKNLYGIKECELDGKSIELIGKNGAGKSSALDAIKLALTNRSDRPYIIHGGETEGEIFVEFDSGITIDRKYRTQKSDYKSIRENGKEVQNPEKFLRDIFTPLQLQPMEFMNMSEKEQNAIILDMIQFEWDLNWIKAQFGEIPQDVDYSQNILQVLNDIQSEDGYYFKTRQDVNRDIRNKKAFIEDIADTIPAGYDADKWENENLGELYRKIETIQRSNRDIEKAKEIIESRDGKIRAFQAKREIALASLDREMTGTRERLLKEHERIKAQLAANAIELAGLEEKKKDKADAIEAQYNADVARYDAEAEEYKAMAEKQPEDPSELVERAEYTEEMKGHINEYRRMESLQDEVEDLSERSKEFTRKIELARELPGIILQEATIPIKNLTVKNGIPLINGLPISNLSDGEKLDLCISVATQNPNKLQIILIDGIEKLSKKNREELYKRCKERDLQFLATRTTDDEDLTIIEL